MFFAPLKMSHCKASGCTLSQYRIQVSTCFQYIYVATGQSWHPLDSFVYQCWIDNISSYCLPHIYITHLDEVNNVF